MKAAWYEQPGNACEVLKVGEMPVPVPGPGEVRIRLAISGVNPSDVKMRRRPLTFPRVVPHSDGAGTIDAVGEGVAAGRIGERVWTWNGQWKRAMGTAAEYIVLPEAQAVRLPDAIDFAAGACLGIPALTAIRAVQLMGDIAGKPVLVTGASSAVGHYITQIATLKGAQVIGTVGSDEKADHARQAGAVETIAYKTESVIERVKSATAGQGVAAVADMDFSSTAAFLPSGLVAPHGRYVCYGSNTRADTPVSYQALLTSSISLHFFLVYDLPPDVRLHAVRELTTLLEHGSLMHTIGARFPLDAIYDAHEAIEKGSSIGNIVIDVHSCPTYWLKA